MSKYIKGLSVVYGLVALVFGAPLLLAPGRFLDIFGWAPVDPLLSRLLGAALLALAWGSLRSFQAQEKAQTRTFMEISIAFNLFGAIGFARHLFRGHYYPFMVWFVFGLNCIFAIAWAIANFRD